MKKFLFATGHHPAVSDRAFNRFLRYPANRPLEGSLAENAAWARDWFRAHGRPWCCAIRAEGAARERAASLFAGATDWAVIVASAGPEAETEAAARYAADEPDRYFFLDSYASAVVDALVVEARVALHADKHLSPGHRGWSIEDNRLLLATIRATAPLLGPLDVLSSGMLVPKKSQLAVCGVAAVELAADRAPAM
jgi:hypothetical protein